MEDSKTFKGNLKKIFEGEAITVIKYVVALIMIFYCFERRHNGLYLTAQLIELCIIFALTEIIHQNTVRKTVNAVLLALFDAQVMVMAFGTTYVSVTMLTNLDNAGDLAGHGFIYIFSIVVVILDALLPHHLLIERKHGNGALRTLTVLLAIDLIFTMIAGNTYSPIYQFSGTIGDLISVKQTESRISRSKGDLSKFYHAEVPDNIKRPQKLKKNPNIILIFTEGLSANVVDDSRNIMPNVKAYEKKSLNFTNYYNHTFATYRGLEGQLYSGYSLNNEDQNNLVSLQSILKDNGYHTTFINAEPNNYQFTRYLNAFDFDVLDSKAKDTYHGNANSLSDKEAYQELWRVVKKEGKKDKPFFTSIYTFGTHASLDSTDLKFGSGSDPLENKFYNADHWFGEFMKKFEKSDLADNTVVIFTADHCTYRDDDFSHTFPNYKRITSECDRIPLFFYYKGIKAESRDANGNTSVGLAPSILDYIDISGDNYFLGSSLFNTNLNTKTEFDTTFWESSRMYDTTGGQIKSLTGNTQKSITQTLNDYFAAKKKKVQK